MFRGASVKRAIAKLKNLVEKWDEKAVCKVVMVDGGTEENGWTVREIASLFHVPQEYVRQLARAGALKCEKVGDGKNYVFFFWYSSVKRSMEKLRNLIEHWNNGTVPAVEEM